MKTSFVGRVVEAIPFVVISTSPEDRLYIVIECTGTNDQDTINNVISRM